MSRPLQCVKAPSVSTTLGMYADRGPRRLRWNYRVGPRQPSWSGVGGALWLTAQADAGRVSTLPFRGRSMEAIVLPIVIGTTFPPVAPPIR
jgi:hypothetical protein